MINQPIFDMLQRISSKSKGSCFTINCAYSDGLDETLLEITFYQKQKTLIVGKIIYSQKTGRVCRYFYKKKRFDYASEIMNLLLDIYNLELSSKVK